MDLRFGGSPALLIALGLALAPVGMAHSAEAADNVLSRANDSQEQWFRQQLAQAHAMARANQFDRAGIAFARLVDDPMLASLPVAEQRAALSRAGWVAIQRNDLTRALPLYRRAVAVDDSDPDDWYRIAMIEVDERRFDAGAVAFTQIVERWPHLLKNVEERPIMTLVRESTTGSPERVALLRALFDANWNGRLGASSEVWYELAVEAMDRNDPNTARAAITRIASPRPLVRLHADKRFDSVMPGAGWATNAERAAQLEIDALSEQAELAPDDLEVRAYLMGALLTAGQTQQALDLATRTLDTIAQASPDEPPFKNLDDQVWLMNDRAIALRRLGRTDEALTELQRAAQLSEEGDQNVSQALNLGVFYCSLNRPDDALAAIRTLGQVSGYGRMVEAGVRHCANLLKGNRSAARKALAYLRDHRKEGQQAYLEALLYQGDLDTAAAQLRELLSTSAERGGTLRWVQDYLRPAPLPGDVAAREARKALLARADVREAIDAVGRIAHYDLYLTSEMD